MDVLQLAFEYVQKKKTVLFVLWSTDAEAEYDVPLEVQVEEVTVMDCAYATSVSELPAECGCTALFCKLS